MPLACCLTMRWAYAWLTNTNTLVLWRFDPVLRPDCRLAVIPPAPLLRPRSSSSRSLSRSLASPLLFPWLAMRCVTLLQSTVFVSHWAYHVSFLHRVRYAALPVSRHVVWKQFACCKQTHDPSMLCFAGWQLHWRLRGAHLHSNWHSALQLHEVMDAMQMANPWPLTLVPTTHMIASIDTHPSCWHFTNMLPFSAVEALRNSSRTLASRERNALALPCQRLATMGCRQDRSSSGPSAHVMLILHVACMVWSPWVLHGRTTGRLPLSWLPCSWVQQQLRSVRLCGSFSHGMRWRVVTCVGAFRTSLGSHTAWTPTPGSTRRRSWSRRKVRGCVHAWH